jgi:hypothetical protein
VAREKSGLLSALGVVFEIVKAIIDEVLNLGGNDEDVRRILKDENLRKAIAQMIIAAKSFVAATFKVTVDYGQSLADMIKAGKYDWVNDNITKENFPVNGQDKQEVEVLLFHFNRVISSDDAIAEMNKAGYRPARIEELLALGACQPELQKQFPIVALGSAWRRPSGYRIVPCLVSDGSGRRLDLDDFEGGWDGSDRFLVLRK